METKVEGRSLGSVETMRGRIRDADSHEMIPCNHWEENFGAPGALLANFMVANFQAGADSNEAFELAMPVDADSLEITEDSVWRRQGWEKAGPRAPGAIDMGRRLEVLDLMGVGRQNVFSTYAIIGMALVTCSMPFFESVFGAIPAGIEPDFIKDMGRMIIQSWNDWVIEKQRLDPDRLRIVGALETTDFDRLMAETERLLAAGVRSLLIPASVPPGGKSPADRSVAPFWSMVEEADATVYLHLAFEDFLQSVEWRQIPEFAMDTGTSAEFIIEPWSLATQHMVMENFLTTIVLGGVFERHPNLRFGVIECGAHWVGPMAENLDKWATVFKRRMSKVLSMPPSGYFSRNIRVTPYLFEPVHKFVERFGLEDVYVYGSDYPHVEGGTDQLQAFAKTIEPLGESFAEKFFVTNAELLMPAATA